MLPHGKLLFKLECPETVVVHAVEEHVQLTLGEIETQRPHKTLGVISKQRRKEEEEKKGRRRKKRKEGEEEKEEEQEEEQEKGEGGRRVGRR